MKLGHNNIGNKLRTGRFTPRQYGFGPVGPAASGIRAIYCDEWGRIIGRAEETDDEKYAKRVRSMVKQITTEFKGTQRRPCLHPFRFLKQVSP